MPTLALQVSTTIADVAIWSHSMKWGTNFTSQMIGRKLGIPRGSSNTPVIPTLDEMCIRSVAEKDPNSGRTLHLSMYSLWTRPQERPFGKAPVWRIPCISAVILENSYLEHLATQSTLMPTQSYIWVDLPCIWKHQSWTPTPWSETGSIQIVCMILWYNILCIDIYLPTPGGRQVNINATTLAVISTNSMQSVSISITVLTMQKWRVGIKGSWNEILKNYMQRGLI